MQFNLTDMSSVALGGISGAAATRKFGRNNDIDIGTEDIWSVGGTWAAPATAAVVNFVSSSAADAAAGTGARTITVSGLNGSYAEVSETITLNGTTPVASVNGYFIVHRVIVATAGTGATNAGTLTGTSAAAGTPVLIGVVIGQGQSQFGIYQVPANKQLLVFSIGASSTTTGETSVSLYAKPFGGVFNLKDNFVVTEGSTHKQYCIPLQFAEKTIIKMSGTVTVNNSDVSASWDGILFDA